MDWQDGFRHQAISDYLMYKKLIDDPEVERCHSLHYLVMATEKLAKHFLTRSGERPKLSHLMFKDFVLRSAMIPSIRRACQFGKYPGVIGHFKQYCIALAPAAERIQALAPQGTMDSVNSEYPWEHKEADPANPGGYTFTVEVPCLYLYEEFDPKRDPKIQNLMKFIESCFKYVSAQTA